MKGQIVIVEGLERMGKTILCEEFERCGYIYFKDFHRVKVNKLSDMQNRLDVTLTFLQNMYESGLKVVVDRFHISEYAYGKVLRNEYAENIKYVDNALSKMNTKLVLCDTCEEYKQYEKHAFIKYNNKQFDDLRNTFNYFFVKSEINDKYEYNFLKESAFGFVNIIDRLNFKYDFYLASPFFNKEQIEREENIKQTLRLEGYTVYSPRENGVLTPDATSEVRTKIFNENCEAIQNSCRVLAITDGKDIGTIWEAGYAYGIGKEIVYYAETLNGNPFNVMLGKSGIGVYTDYRKFNDACIERNFTNSNEKELNVQ